MRSHTCPKCQSSMTEGFIAFDKSGLAEVAGWSEGAPKKGWFGVKNKGKPVQISTWRCNRCGFLENYAVG